MRRFGFADGWEAVELIALSLAVIALFVAAGCATLAPPPRPPAAIPPPADVDQLVRPPPRPLKPTGEIARFKPHPTRSGECAGFPAGILVDHLVYAELRAAVADREHLQAVTVTLQALRGKERAIALQVEQAWLERAGSLEQALLAEQRLTTWKVAAALVAGLAIGFLAGQAFYKPALP